MPLLSVFAALPIGTFCALSWLFYRRGKPWHDTVLAAATACGVYTFVVSELLSICHALSRAPIAAAWALALVAAFITARRQERAERAAFVPLARDERALLAAAATLVALLALTTVFAAPNVWDAMMYHLPRVVRWLDERSVALYPTIDYQQLTMPPWHEYATLQVHALWGSDRLDAFVSLLSALGCAVAVARIADTLGASRRGQILAAIACLTLPQGVLCASSPKNEWSVALWLAVTLSSALCWRREQTAFHALTAGAALGLAICTKGTAYIYAPFLIVAAAVRWDAPALRRFLRWSPLLIVLCLAPNVPGALRTRQLSGSLLATSHVGDHVQDRDGRDDYSVAHISLPGTAAQVLRYLALHLGTPLPAINQRTEAALAAAMRAIGTDPDDPGALLRGKSTQRVFPFHVNASSRHEILAGNPWHLLLLLAALVSLWRRPRNLDALLVGAGLALGFIALAAYVRWQPFSARLHLPLFAIGGALIGLWMARWRPWLAAGAGALLLLLALPFALRNDLRPLVSARAGASSAYATRSVLSEPRPLGYFYDNHKQLGASWIAAATAIARTGCRDIGLDADDYYTYPMFALLGAGTERRVRYVSVANRSADFEGPESRAPCAVVCLQCSGQPSRLSRFDRYGSPAWFGDVAVFQRK